MFVDKVNITIKAGNGGDGAATFKREKYIPNGGPDGGDGGNGGNVVFKVDRNLNNLVGYHYNQKFKAKNGEPGASNNKYGKSGDDIVIKVPKGTLLKDAETGKVIADLFYDNQEETVLEGGKGGRGNAKFANSVRQAPKFSESGEKTKEKEVLLELRTIADVGLIGYPNVGKSKMLSILSNAKPKVGNYHFTTTSPNLGIAEYDGKKVIVADIPGLLEGASQGVGLGHDFLKHIQRTRILVHVVDISGSEGRDPIEDFKVINNELENYSKTLSNAPQIVVLNKTDLLETRDNIEKFKEKYSKDYKIIEAAVVSYKGVKEILQAIIESVSKLPESKPIEPEIRDFDKRDYESLHVIKDEDGIYNVEGGLVDKIIRGINLSDTQSFAYFQKRLKQEGIIIKLKDMGMQDGDLVRISNIEFEYKD